MITFTEHALAAANIPTSPSQAVFAAREMISSTAGVIPGAGCQLISKLLGLTLDAKQFLAEAKDVKPTSLIDYELTVTQAVVETLVKNVGTPLDEVDVLQAAKARAHKFVTNPATQYYFAKADTGSSAPGNEQIVAGSSVDVKVAVKADGSIKKGGKEVLAVALYEKHVKNAETPLDNQGFIAVLMKELGMTKAGATTYNYNMKKKFGAAIATKAAK